mmetsp:Transcript_67463/g.173743  ORF Transcript_67463/g.173743 Transcript_67463/m.173743 type:complete len:228 (+) Transcript_67463:44-727(+)
MSAPVMTITVSELFQEYENDFLKLRAEIDEHLDKAQAGGKDESDRVSQAEKRTGRAESALKQMEMEARSLPPESKSDVEPRMRSYRSDLSSRRKGVENARQAAARRELLKADADPALGKSVRDRERLLTANEGLAQSTSRLEEAHRQALETEQIGIGVMSDLRQQRDVIMRTRGNVGEIGRNTGIAGRFLDSMARRANSNKMMVYGVSALMVVMLCIAAYFLFGGGR